MSIASKRTVLYRLRTIQSQYANHIRGRVTGRRVNIFLNFFPFAFLRFANAVADLPIHPSCGIAFRFRAISVDRPMIVEFFQRRNIYYGWVIVSVAFVTMFLVMGFRFAFGVYYVAILEDTGWQRAETAAVSPSTVTQKPKPSPWAPSAGSNFACSIQTPPVRVNT